MRLGKEHKEIFRQTLENRYINGERRIISKLFLGKENVRMGVERTGSKLRQVGGFVISDFELRNLIEYYHGYGYRFEIYFNSRGAKLFYLLVSEWKTNLQANIWRCQAELYSFEEESIRIEK